MRASITVSELDWKDLQREMVTRVAIVLLIVAWVIWWYVMEQEEVRLDLVSSVVAVITVCFAILGMARRHARAAAILLIGMTFAATAVAYLGWGFTWVGYFFSVPILLTGVLLGPWSALPLVVFAWGCLLWRAPGGYRSDGIISGILVSLLTFLLMAVMGALRAALTQAWQYNAWVATLAEEAMYQRGEVNRLNKALNLANDLLKRRNQELAAAHREAAEARHLKEQFAIHVSHELRTPLNIILGFLEVMQRFPEVYGDVRWTPTLRRDIAEIQRSARYLSDLVDDILDLARIEALKMPIRREPTQLEDLLYEVKDLAQRLLQDKPVDMRVIVPEPLPPLYIDRTRIRQVLLNLLTNASRFTMQGEICIRAVQEGREIIVSVSDTGIGIPPDQLNSLFVEFHQVSSAQRISGSGKGLGLAIAKRFVEMHGGRIWAESQIGRGSTFYFSLPLIEKQVGFLSPAAPVEEIPMGERPSLVVVDQDGAAYLRRRLEGYEILSASDLEEARRLTREQHPTAVLLNVPPGMEGTTQETPLSILMEGVPLLRCSLPMGSWLIDRELFDDWLVKPVGSKQLLQTIERYCQRGCLLVVDDDRSFVQLIRRILQAAGDRYRLQWAYDGEEALRKLRSQEVGLLLLDIALPGPDGHTIAQVMRNDATLAHIPIVAVSASPPGLESPRERFCTFAVTRNGGFSEDELLNLIRNTLRHVKPRYVAASPASEFPGVPAGIPAS